VSAASQSGWDVVSDEPTSPTPPPPAKPTTPTKPAAQPQQGASDWDVASDEVDANKPQAPPPESATDFLLNQAPHSIYRAATNLGHSVIHPIDTLSGVGNLVAGTFKAAARGAGFEMPENESDQVVRQFVDYAKSRWGGVNEIKNALYHDPAGMLMDFSTALSGAGGVLRGAGVLSGVEAASTVGRGVSKLGEIANPMYVPSKVVSGTVRSLLPKKPAAPPEAAFNPKNATFAGEEAFDPKTGTFEDAPGGYKSPQPKPPESMQDTVHRLRTQWGVKPPKSGVETPQPAAAEPPPPPKPAAQPAAPPTPPARPAGWKNIAGPLAGFGVTGLAAEYLTHHVLGSIGAGFLAGSAVKLLPQLLKSEAGQQMLARIGPGSNAAAVAGVAKDLVPALNTLYQSQLYQQSLGQHSVLERASGGPINPELARLQRERLRLPGIHDMLQRKY
jgi:hypothetical protein